MIESISHRAGAGADLKRARRNGAAHARPTIDRLPPHSHEAEQGALGCQLLSPNECVGEVIQKGVSNDSYYDLRHQTIQDELVTMFNKHIPIDVVTLQQRLKDRKLLEQCGGVVYLAQLQDAVPSAANLSYYLDIVQEKFLLRKMIHTCTDAVGRIYDYEGEVDKLVDEVERDILAIRPRRKHEDLSINKLVQQSIDDIEVLHNSKGAITGLPTGFIDLDDMTNGLHESELTIISALPSFGKTSLGMNIIEHISLELGKPTGIFTLEMSARQLVTRMICSTARVNLRDVRKGKATDEDFARMTATAKKLSKAGIYFHDMSDMTVYEMRTVARRWWQEHGIVAILADYLQLLRAPSSGKHFRTSAEETAEVSSQLKNMSKEFKLPVLAISSLTELDNGKTRLRNSGDIKYDGDNVLKLRWASKEEREKYEGEGALSILEIQKQRNGPTGKIKLVFLRKFTRFENAAKVSDEDVPAES